MDASGNSKNPIIVFDTLVVKNRQPGVDDSFRDLQQASTASSSIAAADSSPIKRSLPDQFLEASDDEAENLDKETMLPTCAEKDAKKPVAKKQRFDKIDFFAHRNILALEDVLSTDDEEDDQTSTTPAVVENVVTAVNENPVDKAAAVGCLSKEKPTNLTKFFNAALGKVEQDHDHSSSTSAVVENPVVTLVDETSLEAAAAAAVGCLPKEKPTQATKVFDENHDQPSTSAVVENFVTLVDSAASVGCLSNDENPSTFVDDASSSDENSIELSTNFEQPIFAIARSTTLEITNQDIEQSLGDNKEATNNLGLSNSDITTTTKKSLKKRRTLKKKKGTPKVKLQNSKETLDEKSETADYSDNFVDNEPKIDVRPKSVERKKAANFGEILQDLDQIGGAPMDETAFVFLYPNSYSNSSNEEFSNTGFREESNFQDQNDIKGLILAENLVNYSESLPNNENNTVEMDDEIKPNPNIASESCSAYYDDNIARENDDDCTNTTATSSSVEEIQNSVCSVRDSETPVEDFASAVVDLETQDEDFTTPVQQRAINASRNSTHPIDYGYDVQKVDCCELPISYGRCSECQNGENNRTDDVACRFKYFRKRKRKGDNFNLENRFSLASEHDVMHWVEECSSSVEARMSSQDACYVISNLSAEFNRIVNAEQQFLEKYENWELYLGTNKIPLPLKRTVNIREFCDVCSRSIFNLHMFCPNCGYTVCPFCVEKCRARRDPRYNWRKFHCPNVKHGHTHTILKLCQIIPDNSSLLKTLNTLNNNVKVIMNLHQTMDLPRNIPALANEDHNTSAECLCGINPLLEHVPEPLNLQYYFDEDLLIINNCQHPNALTTFQTHWRKFRPVLVRNIDKYVNLEIWQPRRLQFNCVKPNLQLGSVQDCLGGDVFTDYAVDKFWWGFLNTQERDEMHKLLKLKDWPADEHFSAALPSHYENFCSALPFPEYSHPTNGKFSLTTHLPPNYLKPDLGPKMYCAYEMIDHPLKGSTNLHIDGSDAVNMLVNVTVPTDKDNEEFYQNIYAHLENQQLDAHDAGFDPENRRRMGALWTIFKPEDTPIIRKFLEKMSSAGRHSDPIHDQLRYLHPKLRQQLRDEHNVHGYTFVQLLGDAVFIPAGAAHQVQNLTCCVKMAEDFVSPESVRKCAEIDGEFRQLSTKHTNHEDKLQLPNVVVHSVKEAVNVLKSQLDVPDYSGFLK